MQVLFVLSVCIATVEGGCVLVVMLLVCAGPVFTVGVYYNSRGWLCVGVCRHCLHCQCGVQ